MENAKIADSGHILTVHEMFPNPIQRMLFRVRSIGDALISEMEAASQKGALAGALLTADHADRDDIDTYLDDFYKRTREDLYTQRQMKRWNGRCEVIVDRCIGSYATQRAALAFIDVENL